MAVLWVLLALAAIVIASGALANLPRLGGLLVPSTQGAGAAAGDAVLVRLALPAPEARAVPQEPAGPPPVIAIVIDDLGNDAEQDRRAIALPRAVSLSFLPYPEATPELAREAQRAGHEILAHVPMQAEDSRITAPMALRVGLSADENIRRLDWALMRVPGHVGINNHEGSAFTQDRDGLAAVDEALYGRGIFFLDSRTTPQSQVVQVARSYGVQSAARDVFLDDDQSSGAVAYQLGLLERIARRKGVAIAIGHPHAVTLDVLTRWCEDLRGYRLIRVSAAIRMKTEKEVGAEVANSR